MSAFTPVNANNPRVGITRGESIDLPDVSFLSLKPESGGAVPGEIIISDFKRKEMNGELVPEPLLIEDKSRFVLFPIKHNDVSRLC